MLSDEKMIHIVHLLLDGIEKAGMVSYTSKDEAVRESKMVCLKYLSHLSEVESLARKRIASQKNAPPEYSMEWDNLFKKYCEEELRKQGG